MFVETDDEIEAMARAAFRQVASEWGDAPPGEGHDRCWESLCGLGFARAANEGTGRGTPGSITLALILLEEMARSLFGASLVWRALLVPELLSLADVPDRRPRRSRREDDWGCCWRVISQARRSASMACVGMLVGSVTHSSSATARSA